MKENALAQPSTAVAQYFMVLLKILKELSVSKRRKVSILSSCIHSCGKVNFTRQ